MNTEFSVTVSNTFEEVMRTAQPFKRTPGNYLDPIWNQLVQVRIQFQCSWAVARDWHRHRTAYPWDLSVVVFPTLSRTSQEDFTLHERYKIMSQKGQMQAGVLLEESANLFYRFLDQDDYERAMLCLPLGTTVQMAYLKAF